MEGNTKQHPVGGGGGGGRGRETLARRVGGRRRAVALRVLTVILTPASGMRARIGRPRARKRTGASCARSRKRTGASCARRSGCAEKRKERAGARECGSGFGGSWAVGTVAGKRRRKLQRQAAWRQILGAS